MKQLLITIAAVVLVGCGSRSNRLLLRKQSQLMQLLKFPRGYLLQQNYNPPKQLPKQ